MLLCVVLCCAVVCVGAFYLLEGEGAGAPEMLAAFVYWFVSNKTPTTRTHTHAHNCSMHIHTPHNIHGTNCNKQTTQSIP